ncbi:hypothetical protein BDV33DRAFT_201590 [Aspergillus novoparasiticus]|uniref:Uncharacterized protein n=1 Tax=Aspergillus novoparasiticus TaxID=986946 RepID=A0A5N6EXU9_9EURO|nr:hypothetical protein BDV33DRAFT_201590 [Aspergillus novoparasiticus]
MLPKICYFLFYLFLTLVAATPVALEERAPKPAPSDLLGIKLQEINDVNKPANADKSQFIEYSSILTFTDGSKITNDHIVGLAKAAWEEMYVKHMAKYKNKATVPGVMSAMKVGNEVHLASSMKGGGSRYIYVAREENLKPDSGKKTPGTDKKPGSDKKNPADKKNPGSDKKTPTDSPAENQGVFTSVLKENAKDVMEALIDVSKQSQGHKNGKTAAVEQAASGSANGQGSKNTKGGKPPSDPTIIQHRTSASCGEVMVSLEYRLAHKQDTLRKKTPKPKIVAWVGDKETGNKGKILDPCGKSKNPKKQDDDACGENWGCAAFTGPAGMDFDVIPSAKPIDPSTKGFPKFTHRNVDFPTPAKIPSQ